MWRTADTPDPVFTDTLELDLDDVQPSLAGPKRPQDRVTLDDRQGRLRRRHGRRSSARRREIGRARARSRAPNFDLGHGDVVIAAITSCTNTSNPSVMIGAGLLARNAVAKGLQAEALGEDLARAGLAGRRRVSREGRPAGATSTRSASTSSASAAPPASAIPGRCRRTSRRRSTTTTSSRVLGALRQPQLRGPRQPGRARELPRLAAARRRLRARRLDARRPDARSRSAPAATASRSTSRTSGPRPSRSRSSSTARSPASCSRPATPTCSRATRTGRTVDGRAAA